MKIRGSYLWAAAMLVGLAGWLASGLLMKASVVDGDGQVIGDQTPQLSDLATVRVRTIEARQRRSKLVIRGRTEADQRVELRAETAGRVNSTPHAKGAFVSSGSVLCELDLGERAAKLAEMRAAVDQAQLDYDASVTLKKRGFSAATEEAARKAKLDAAMAALNLSEIDIERTRTRAPFDGVLEERNAKEGVWLAVGEVCATLVDLDPMLIVGQVSERDISKLKVGMGGSARLVTGEQVEGYIGYISSTADQATRTFRIELQVENADRALRDGVTAEIVIPLKSDKAHQFSPAVLTLDDEGRIGVRLLDENNIVRFAAVDIIADSADGVWVAGLPERVRLITVGQEYVEAGQRVRPVPADGGE